MLVDVFQLISAKVIFGTIWLGLFLTCVSWDYFLLISSRILSITVGWWCFLVDVVSSFFSWCRLMFFGHHRLRLFFYWCWLGFFVINIDCNYFSSLGFVSVDIDQGYFWINAILKLMSGKIFLSTSVRGVGQHQLCFLDNIGGGYFFASIDYDFFFLRSINDIFLLTLARPILWLMSTEKTLVDISKK